MQLLLANWRIAVYLLGIAALFGGGWWLHHTGYRDGVKETKASYEIAMKAETDRIAEANRIALEEAARLQDALLRAIRLRNEKIDQLQSEADSDANANDGAFSANSVRRLNQIR